VKQPQWLDGPKLAELIDERMMGATARSMGDSFSRRLYAWRNGESVRYETADRYIVRLPSPIHEWELEDIWIDMKKKRSNCPRGHSFTPENTYFEKGGQRRCRACLQLRDKGALTAINGVRSEKSKKKAVRLAKLGKTQAELAAEYDVHPRTIRRWIEIYGS
jgi:hypothetical protein